MKKLNPTFRLSDDIKKALRRIEEVKVAITSLPITPHVLLSLRESSRLEMTHYSTYIEGNRLSGEQVAQVIQQQRKIAGRQRDENEVKGYYAALQELEYLASRSDVVITTDVIKKFHSLVYSEGSGRAKRQSDFRDGQNVIRDGTSGATVYLPPEAQDVSNLMKQLVEYLNDNSDPIPVAAAIAHYQFETIHPFFDGNGRTGRILTTLYLHLNGYDLKGIYSLDEYYAKDLNSYYQHLSVGSSHNYYEGRAEADITEWIEYFCQGMAASFEKVFMRAREAQVSRAPDQSAKLRKLDLKQRRVLQLFAQFEQVTTKQIAEWLGVRQHSALYYCKSWLKQGFIIVGQASRKTRTYVLAPRYLDLLDY